MKWNWYIRSMVLLILLCTSVKYSSAASPFVYYFSAAESAFIVEAANGTNRYRLVDYVLPPMHTEVVGAGWSSSGNWFSWYSRRANGSGSQGIYLIDRGAEKFKNILPLELEIEELIWSPTDEILLIRYSPSINNVILYDPMTDAILFDLNIAISKSGSEEANLRVEWSPDGGHLLIHDTISSIGWIISIPSFQIVKTFNAYSFYQYHCASAPNQLPQWVTPFTFAYVTQDGQDFVVQNIYGDETHIALLDPNVEFSQWSFDRNYVLFYTYSEAESTSQKVWILDITKQEIHLITSTGFLNSTCKFLLHAPVFWNSDNQFYFLSEDGQIYIVSPTIDITPHKVLVPSEGRLIDERDILWIPGNRLEFIWYEVESLTMQLYQYIPLSNSISQPMYTEPDIIENASVISISPSGYIAYGETLVNPINKERVDIGVDEHEEFGPLGIDDVKWHPTEDWMFIVSSEIDNLHLIVLRNIEGTSVQELGLCPVHSKTCYGWMP